MITLPRQSSSSTQPPVSWSSDSRFKNYCNATILANSDIFVLRQPCKLDMYTMISLRGSVPHAAQLFSGKCFADGFREASEKGPQDHKWT